MRIFGTKMHVAVGLAAIVTTAAVFATLLGIVPDRLGAERRARASLAESVAAGATALLTAREERRVESVLHFVMNRNPEVLSIAVRERGGRILSAAGEHAANWEPLEGGLSTDTQLSVPIWTGQHRWGQLEMRYRPLISPGIRGIAEWPGVRSEEHTSELQSLTAISYAVSLDRKSTRLNSSHSQQYRMPSSA